MKVCKGCKENKERFHKDKNEKDGLARYCVDCVKEKTRLYYVKHKSKHKNKHLKRNKKKLIINSMNKNITDLNKINALRTYESTLRNIKLFEQDDYTRVKKYSSELFCYCIDRGYNLSNIHKRVFN